MITPRLFAILQIMCISKSRNGDLAEGGNHREKYGEIWLVIEYIINFPIKGGKNYEEIIWNVSN